MMHAGQRLLFWKPAPSDAVKTAENDNWQRRRVPSLAAAHLVVLDGDIARHWNHFAADYRAHWQSAMGNVTPPSRTDAATIYVEIPVPVGNDFYLLVQLAAQHYARGSSRVRILPGLLPRQWLRGFLFVEPASGDVIGSENDSSMSAQPRTLTLPHPYERR